MTAKILVVDRESDLEALKSADAEFWLSMSWAILTQGIDLTAARFEGAVVVRGR